MSTLLERLEQAERVAKDHYSSTTKWCIAAGVSRGYVTTLKNRLRTNPDASGLHRDLEKIANAIKMDSAWLITGDSSGDRGMFGKPDPYPSRIPVVALLRSVNAPAGVIDALESIRLKEGDPGHEYWASEADKFIKDVRRFERLLENSVPFVDHKPQLRDAKPGDGD